MTFQKGESGNLAGRPKGLVDRRSIFRNMVASHAEELVEKAVELALTGNEQMLKLLLDRLLPAKPRNEPIDIGQLHGSLDEQCGQVFTALEQELTPNQCATLIQSIGVYSKIKESEQLRGMLEEALTKLDKLNSIE